MLSIPRGQLLRVPAVVGQARRQAQADFDRAPRLARLAFDLAGLPAPALFGVLIGLPLSGLVARIIREALS